MKKAILLAVLAFAAAPSSVRAEETGPCKADMEKFCKGVEPGEGRHKKCLKEHEAELSEGCKQMAGKMAERKEKMDAAKEACKADKEKFCKGVEPGEGRLMKCMKEHEAELSEGCRKVSGEMKEKMKEKMKGASEACKADKEKFCKDVEPGEGRIVKCLKEHEAELSEACKARKMHKHEGKGEKKEKMKEEHKEEKKG